MSIPADYFYQLLTSMNVRKSAPGISYVLDFSELGRALDVAQHKLDAQVWLDMQRYMPGDSMGAGGLKGETNALNVVTHGEVYAFPPDHDYGHYQWEGKLYVDPITGKGAFYSPDFGFWSRPGVPKVKTDKNLNYKQPNARPHWDEVAIQNHLPAWEEVVRRALS